MLRHRQARSLVLRWAAVLCVVATAPVLHATEVVRTGDQLPTLLGEQPEALVGYAWDGARWNAIPVQVDEREWVDAMVALIGRDLTACFSTACEESVGLAEVLDYTDPGTLVGPDTDATFDADDELVFMARFGGSPAPANRHPTGVVTSTRTAVAAGSGVVYLYAASGSANPGAGQDLVTYRFALASGPYPETYDFEGQGGFNGGSVTGSDLGVNPEASWVETDAYRTAFADRWIQDELYVKNGGALGPDFLDRAKFLFAPGTCDRTEWTASASIGAIAASIDGPVRGVRVVRGFNSGPLTTRTHYFYETDIVTVTDLRVHPVPSLMDLYDYAPTLTGATYDNAENQGLLIDAIPDAFRAGDRAANAPYWEVVNAPTGSVTTALQVATDLSGLSSIRTYYAEGSGVLQCTGDASDRGTSGVYIEQRVSETDPRETTFWTLTGLRRTRMSSAPMSRSDAAAFAETALVYYGPTPTRRFDGTTSAGGGVAPPPPPPSEPPPSPDQGADLAVSYDGTTATVTNNGPETATGAEASYLGAGGTVSLRLPPLAPGDRVTQRIAPVDDCVRVEAGNQTDPNLANNEACDGSDPPPPPSDPPPTPDQGADLAVSYDGTTATVTNNGPDTSTGGEASYTGRRGTVTFNLPPLAPGASVSQRVGSPVDDCIRVEAGAQADPEPANNEACLGTRTAAQAQALPADALAGVAYPNPFTPRTTIAYTLPAAGSVTLAVYDALGRRVALLAEGVHDAGTYQALFDATDLPSGLYLYRLDTDHGTVTGRMTLLR